MDRERSGNDGRVDLRWFKYWIPAFLNATAAAEDSLRGMPFAQRLLPTRSTVRYPRRRVRPVSGTFSSASGGSRLRVAAQLGAWRRLRDQWESRSLGNMSEASKRVRGRTGQ